MLNSPLRSWLKSNHLTAIDLANKLQLNIYQVRRVATRTCTNLNTIVLIHAFTLIPLDKLLPLKLLNTANKLRKIRSETPQGVLVRCTRKLFLDSQTFAHNTIFEVTFSDRDLIRLQRNGQVFHIPHSTFNELFVIDNGTYFKKWLKQSIKPTKDPHRRRPSSFLSREFLNFQDHDPD